MFEREEEQRRNTEKEPVFSSSLTSSLSPETEPVSCLPRIMHSLWGRQRAMLYKWHCLNPDARSCSVSLRLCHPPPLSMAVHVTCGRVVYVQGLLWICRSKMTQALSHDGPFRCDYYHISLPLSSLGGTATLSSSPLWCLLGKVTSKLSLSTPNIQPLLPVFSQLKPHWDSKSQWQPWTRQRQQQRRCT